MKTGVHSRSVDSVDLQCGFGSGISFPKFIGNFGGGSNSDDSKCLPGFIE